MAPNILEIGEMEKLKDTEPLLMQIMIFMPVNLKKIVLMEKVYILMLVVKLMMDNGSMIYNTDME